MNNEVTATTATSPMNDDSATHATDAIKAGRNARRKTIASTMIIGHGTSHVRRPKMSKTVTDDVSVHADDQSSWAPELPVGQALVVEMNTASEGQMADTHVPLSPITDRLPAAPMLADRLAHRIERELEIIEYIVQDMHRVANQPIDAERCARTLASLARTVGELKKMQSSDMPIKVADGHADPANADAFRLDLAQRLGRIVAEAKSVCAGEGE